MSVRLADGEPGLKNGVLLVLSSFFFFTHRTRDHALITPGMEAA